MTELEILMLTGNILVAIAGALILIGAVGALYPVTSGQICSYNAPCGLKEGYDCSKCEFKIRKSEGIIRTIIALFSFGNYRG